MHNLEYDFPIPDLTGLKMTDPGEMTFPDFDLSVLTFPDLSVIEMPDLEKILSDINKI